MDATNLSSPPRCLLASPLFPWSTITGMTTPSGKSDQQRGKSGWKGLKLCDLTGLSEKIKKKFKWAHTPREFQLQAITAQLLRKDVLIHAGTGSGKTAIAAGPFAHEATEGMVTLFVSPLISLQEEQVSNYFFV